MSCSKPFVLYMMVLTSIQRLSSNSISCVEYVYRIFKVTILLVFRPHTHVVISTPQTLCNTKWRKGKYQAYRIQICTQTYPTPPQNRDTCLPYHTQVSEQHLSTPQTTPPVTHDNVTSLSGESTRHY